MDENIKEAFSKVKEDIDFLNNELLDIKISLNELISKIDNLPNTQKNNKSNSSTIRQINSTDNATSTETSTVPLEVEGLKSLNLPISIGNQGASTDRQTDRQTDTSTDNLPKNTEIKDSNIENNIKEASEILESLDGLKKEIRLKFKHLTSQEMLVFSSIYQFEEQNEKVDYKLLSKSLKLSESSIRDYVQRMINKGIPIKKEKFNNKNIILSISNDLKKIASLSTIIQLRGL